MTHERTHQHFLELIHRHQSIIHKICFVYSKNRSDREDLQQEIILQLWKSFPSFQENAAFSTWMYRVALNTAILYFQLIPDTIGSHVQASVSRAASASSQPGATCPDPSCVRSSVYSPPLLR
ncbi:MAG: RNA polymerase sigma factor [Bacteroidales bacterium]|nr:RNA polymerase sigma factor [Bacteroidales bacterium]